MLTNFASGAGGQKGPLHIGAASGCSPAIRTAGNGESCRRLLFLFCRATRTAAYSQNKNTAAGAPQTRVYKYYINKLLTSTVIVFNSIFINFYNTLIPTLTFFILLFVLKPSILLNSTQLLSLSIFYY